MLDIHPNARATPAPSIKISRSTEPSGIFPNAAAPASFIVVRPEYLLAVSIIALDAPVQTGLFDQGTESRVGWPGR